MINFRDFEELSLSDVDDVIYYIEKMSNFTPLVDEYDYMAIKKYICKILEVIEKDVDDD